MIATMTVGNKRERVYLSKKITRTENGWSSEDVETPMTHKNHKRRYIRITNFRDAGLI
jgi:hypothetical protein